MKTINAFPALGGGTVTLQEPGVLDHVLGSRLPTWDCSACGAGGDTGAWLGHDAGPELLLLWLERDAQEHADRCLTAPRT